MFDPKVTDALTVAADVPLVKHRYIIEHLFELKVAKVGPLSLASGDTEKVTAWRKVAEIELEDSYSRAPLMKYTADNPQAPAGWYRVIEPKGLYGCEEYFVTESRALSIERADYYEQDEAA